MRGEGLSTVKVRSIVPGSSPRPRGRPGGCGDAEPVQRFIPACAGKACYKPVPSLYSPVHPRVRGEGPGTVTVNRTITGSSPRARGRLRSALLANYRSRFIPACAGKARPSIARAWRRAVHPRVRGEGDDQSAADPDAGGSSPRARGRPLDPASVLVMQRFIPACAGKADGTGAVTYSASVHPRVRGEGVSTCPTCGSGDGSSPRARGRPPDGRYIAGFLRFIPACAGKAIKARGMRP